METGDGVGGGLLLDGVRVVDTTAERGALCGRLLADLGADVVLVEPPRGSPARSIPPAHSGVGVPFAIRSLGKRRASADLATPEGRRWFEELLAGADVWIDGSRPGELGRYGLAPGAVCRRFPHLVVTTVTDFGYSGPYRDYEGTDPVLVALSGMLFRAGIPELPPVLPPGTMAYDVAAVTGAAAALIGYWHRLRGGAGQHIDVSVMQSCAQTTDWGLTTFSVIQRAGGVYAEMRNGAGPVYDIYSCKDGYVRMSVVTPAEWRRVRAWLGEPEFLQDPHWDRSASRIEIADVLAPMYRDLFADLTMVEASEEGQRRGLGISPVLPPGHVMTAEHFIGRRTFTSIPLAGGVAASVPSGFLLVDGDRIGPRIPGSDSAAASWSAPGMAAAPASPPTGMVPGPAPPPNRPAGTRRPFEGVRVLDFGVAGAAPEIARLIAEHGGDAIRVESRRRPDLFRVLFGTEMSPTFASSNRSKRSFGVDFATDEGQELIRRLLPAADVVVENLPPGTMESMGLAPEQIRALNPRVITVSSQLMGSTGPWAEWRGYGANAQTTGGLTHLWSFADTPPVGANVAFPDHVVGRLGTAAVAAALARRDRTGVGCHIEIPQVDVVINLLADIYVRESLEPGSARPQGNESERGVPWGVYPCAGEQRWCVITCRDDADWQRLVDALGRPHWATDPVLSTAEGRRRTRRDVDHHLGEWTRHRSDRDVMETLQAGGVPAGRMTYISDEPGDPHLRSQGYVLSLFQPGLGEILLEGPGFTGSAFPDLVTTPAPGLGEHTRDIAGDLLGMQKAEIDALIERGILYEASAGS